MAPDPLADLDLNLLRTLDVLLETCSVTRTAALLGRSQPAISHGLQRLRASLGDPLLVREGQGMARTPRAEAIRPALSALLGELRRVLRAGAGFEPQTSQRTFTLACPDSLAPVLPRVLSAMSAAPGVRLALQVGTEVSAVEGVDVALGMMPEAAPGVMVRRLGAIHQQVALRAGHPALEGAWDARTYVRWPHILVRTPAGPSLVEAALDAAGLERTVGLVVPTFLLAAHMAAGSELLFTSADVLLQQVAGPLGLVLRPPPVAMPAVTAAAMWSARLSADPGHRWFRQRVVGVLEGILADATASSDHQ